jgi:hypothetical protein
MSDKEMRTVVGSNKIFNFREIVQQLNYPISYNENTEFLMALYSLSQNCLPIENRHVPTANETPR